MPTLTIDWNNTLAFTTTPGSVAEIGTAYSYIPAATGGRPPYTFSRPSGTLLSGLTESAGVISGTPTAGGSCSGVIRVTDSVGTVVNQSYGITAVDDAASALVAYGWDTGFDAGTTADYYVATTGNDSTGTGSVGAPWLTLQKALNQVNTDNVPKTIKLRGGKYRGKGELGGIDGLPGNPVVISRYGTESPVLSGAEVLTGWAVCTSGDEADVGDNFASIYKTTLAKSATEASNKLDLYLHENGTFMSWATDRADESDLFIPNADTAFHVADVFGVNGSNQIVSITDTGVISRYTEAQLLNAQAYIYHFSNSTARVAITAVDTGISTISVSGLKTRHSSSQSDWRYSLVNIIPAMDTGQWGVKDNGDNTLTVYCWPTDTGNLTTNIEYAARDHVINLNNADHIKIEGLTVEMVSGNGNEAGIGIGTHTNTGITKTGLTIRQCLIQKTARGYAPIYLSNVDDLLIEKVTVKDCFGFYGIFVNGCSDVRLQTVDVSNTAASGFRCFGANDLIFCYTHLRNTGRGSHTNKFNFYEQCDNILVWGIKCGLDVESRVTWQEASNLVFGFCQLAVDNTNTGIVEQQNATPPPNLASENYLFNLAVLPHPDASGNANAVFMESPYGDKYSLHNSHYYGGGIATISLTSETHNVVTRLSGSGSTAGRVGGKWTAGEYDATVTVETTLANVYTDWENGNYTPKPGGPILTTAAKDLEASGVIAILQARFPDFEYFDRDMNGVQFDWSSPFIGPDSNL